jgi:serine/threonine protein kinase
VAREIDGLKRGACDNLVRVESVEQVTFSIGKRVVITFEYIDGLVLDEAIRTDRWPSPEQVRELLRGVLSGLAVLHGRETVHRDVKPPNLALQDGDWSRPVILDLGLARLLDEKGITKYPLNSAAREVNPTERAVVRSLRRCSDASATMTKSPSVARPGSASHAPELNRRPMRRPIAAAPRPMATNFRPLLRQSPTSVSAEYAPPRTTRER